ncbi:carboxymuconolactone decarboxylase family protein [Pseudomonas sp. URMO17WK12:I12]|uniref:carboxymuconolactone decarboxylase family protein n=1 Tax=Pseudomonas sp. URMO17WK12:I12 TaxID=1259797 RepID=UPI0004888FC6|nr:carboxymuconolactone decarboxylase family protein [Pseudomonas sp. URMO17WK12:I12]
MSRIVIPSIESATDATADIYARVKKLSGGRVPNTYAALGHLIPASLAAVLDAQATLNSGNLSRQEHETIKLLISEKTGCDVCVAAHSFVGKLVGLPVDVLRAIRAGMPTGDAKRDALVRFISHLHATSGTISDDEFNAIREVGYTDIQLAEISLTMALGIFTNTFNRINGTDVDFPSVE